MTEKFSLKAQALYAELQRRGGGAIDEYMVRTRLGISHGTFSAARRELLDAGVLQMEKEGRHPVYILHDLNEMRVGAAAAAEAATPPQKPLSRCCLLLRYCYNASTAASRPHILLRYYYCCCCCYLHA